MIEEKQYEELKTFCQSEYGVELIVEKLPNGSTLIQLANVDIESGWNRPTANVLFIAPPNYPAAQPDCFWVEPNGFRLANGGTPQASNDSNPIPGDINPGRSTTWFSWHVQAWNPNSDTLLGYFKVILNRFKQKQ